MTTQEPTNEIVYDVTMEDLLAYNLDYLKQSRFGRRNLLVYRLSPPLAWLVLGALMILLGTPLNPWAFAFSLTVVSIGWFFLAPIQWNRIIRKRVRKIYAEGQNRTVLGMHRLVLTPEGIENSSETSDTRTKWSAVEKIVEMERYYYLFVGAAQAHIVPKRAFSDEASGRRFIEIARRYREQAAGLEPGTSGPFDLLS